MTPPADIRTVLRALVEAGERATKGRWFAAYAAGDVRKPGRAGWPAAQIVCAVAPRQRVYSDSDGGAFPAADEEFIAAAANARAALSAIAGKVWLDVETVRHLTGRCRCVLTVLADRERHDAALAAAEAEVARVEGQRS